MAAESKVPDQLVQVFVKNINTGRWKKGEKIPSENQMTQILGVSRASVRNAIQYLTALGVLESQHGRGTFLLVDKVDLESMNKNRITARDYEDIDKVLEFRLAVESECAYLAARNVTDKLVKMLHRELEYMEINTENPEAFVRHDLRFHELISQASCNILLEKSLSAIFAERLHNHMQINTLFGFEDGLNYHKRILSAIETGDSETAYHEMQDHMKHAIDRLKNENAYKK